MVRPFWNVPQEMIPMEKPMEKPLTLSATGLRDFLQCEALWYLRHWLHLEPLEKPLPLLAGKLFHDFLQAVHTGADRPLLVFKDRAEMPVEEKAKLYGLAQAYLELGWLPEAACEVKVPHGIIDMITDGPVLWEAKVVATYNKQRYVPFTLSHQVGLYLADLPEIEDVIIQVIEKPDVRPRKGEEAASIARRAYEVSRNDLARTFMRERYHRSDFAPEAVLELCLDKEREIAWKLGGNMELPWGLSQRGFLTKPWACTAWGCEFEPVCRTGQVPPGLYTVKPKEEKE